MYEIEVKAALNDKESLINRLLEQGCDLGPETVQDDTVFVREAGSIEAYLGNSDFLRLREENGQVHFAFKHHSGRASGPNSAPLELELTVSSREMMERVLLQMGYQEAVRIKKKRRKGKYQNWEVCVDEVDGLGSFVELEELTQNPEELPQIQERMKAFLAKLGVQTEDQALYRYDTLLLQKKYREGGVV